MFLRKRNSLLYFLDIIITVNNMINYILIWTTYLNYPFCEFLKKALEISFDFYFNYSERI